MSTFSHIAGDRAMDLLNTVQWRLDPEQLEEDLTSYERVLDWCEESELLTSGERASLCGLVEGSQKAAIAELAYVISVREDAYSALFGGSTRAANSLVRKYQEALGRAELRQESVKWVWREKDLALSTPRDRVVRSLVDLFGSDSLDHLHQCEDRACGWVFLDDSPRRNRRWCVSSDCGDRNRARTYYARKKESRIQEATLSTSKKSSQSN